MNQFTVVGSCSAIYKAYASKIDRMFAFVMLFFSNFETALFL